MSAPSARASRSAALAGPTLPWALASSMPALAALLTALAAPWNVMGSFFGYGMGGGASGLPSGAPGGGVPTGGAPAIDGISAGGGVAGVPGFWSESRVGAFGSSGSGAVELGSSGVFAAVSLDTPMEGAEASVDGGPGPGFSPSFLSFSGVRSTGYAPAFLGVGMASVAQFVRS